MGLRHRQWTSSRDLAKKFGKVYATDISAKQLENAWRKENIFYSVAAEQTTFQDHSIDLITVAQAIHWFDRELFYREVKRVAAKSAILAVWGYGLLRINDALDTPLRNFYFHEVAPYWDPERKLIDERYQTIPFPFEEIKAPEFNFSFAWTLKELEGYLNTWSSVQKYITANNINPVDKLISEIRPLWQGDRQNVNFPLFLRLGRV